MEQPVEIAKRIHKRLASQIGTPSDVLADSMALVDFLSYGESVKGVSANLNRLLRLEIGLPLGDDLPEGWEMHMLGYKLNVDGVGAAYVYRPNNSWGWSWRRLGVPCHEGHYDTAGKAIEAAQQAVEKELKK